MSMKLSVKAAVRPRDAASLVLYRKQAGQIRVLMGKRAKAHRFLPNVFVFPGGRVDASDHRMPALKPLKESVAHQLSQPGNKAHAIGCAAVRETFEETGLTIGQSEDQFIKPDLSGLDYLARAITPAHNPIRFNTRFLMVDADHSSGSLAGSGELLHLQWFPIEDALAMPLVDVTEFVLIELKNRLANPSRPPAVPPLFTYRNGKAMVTRG
ncbi:NUDIX hydrolase [Sneathiella glossodoripedis]|uniref:NUDIX hydrolase n=1 Tax=Sneathiella glossodoripedis TaxID=418853 RepID=UPI0004702E0C|nr:NUDIX hydrolase [Sneathiella glossodoripedis]